MLSENDSYSKKAKKIPPIAAVLRKGRILADFGGISCYSFVLLSYIKQPTALSDPFK